MTEMRRLGIPLPVKHVDVLHASLSWEDFQVAPYIAPLALSISELIPVPFRTLDDGTGSRSSGSMLRPVCTRLIATRCRGLVHP